MLILSQKGKIINYDNVVEITIIDLTINDEKCFGIVVETVNDRKKELAVYSTEERAKEVLQEIIEQYEYCQRLQEGHGISLSSGNNYVYEMPKK